MNKQSNGVCKRSKHKDTGINKDKDKEKQKDGGITKRQAKRNKKTVE